MHTKKTKKMMMPGAGNAPAAEPASCLLSSACGICSVRAAREHQSTTNLSSSSRDSPVRLLTSQSFPWYTPCPV